MEVLTVTGKENTRIHWLAGGLQFGKVESRWRIVTGSYTAEAVLMPDGSLGLTEPLRLSMWGQQEGKGDIRD